MSALSMADRPNLIRLTIVGVAAVLLAVLGFLVPFWIVCAIAAGVACMVAVVRKWRAATHTVDRILAEKLD